MPRFEVTISDAHLARLQAIVAKYNENSGTNYTVKDWVLLHLKDIVIGEQLQAYQEQAQKNAEEQLRQEIEAEIQRLRDAV